MLRNGVVYTEIPRLDLSEEQLHEFKSLGVATVHESMGKINLADSEIRPVCQGLACAGPAVTCHLPAGDNLMVHKALTLVKPGDVLVIYAHGFSRAGLWGELTSIIAKVAGVSGVIIDGGIRDTERIIEMGLPVWSRSVHAGGTDKNGVGSINIPIVFGGMSVEPGDIIVADSDGITAVPRLRALDILELAKEREASEEKAKEQIIKGKTLYETYDMKHAFDQLKIEVFEGSFIKEV